MRNTTPSVKVPYGNARLSCGRRMCSLLFREIFLKTDNYIDGVFFAELLKVDTQACSSHGAGLVCVTF